MSVFLFGKEYKIAEMNSPIILTSEEAELEMKRDDIIRDEYDGEVIDTSFKYDLSNSFVWELVDTYCKFTPSKEVKRAFDIIYPVYYDDTWGIFVAKTTGKIVHQRINRRCYCEIDYIDQY